MIPLIETRAMSKRYGTIQAVREVNLVVEGGEVFGLLGPNGAGKSTVIRMITGLTRPTSGEVFVAGHDVRKAPVAVKRVVGLASEVSTLYGELSAWDNLVFCAKLHDLPGTGRDDRVREMLERTGLERRARDKVGTFSKGMKKRLEIAAALLHDPSLLVLDEPTSGLDVEGKRRVWEIVSSCRERGTGVLLATHLLHEADQKCDRVGIMNHGVLLVVDSPEAIKCMVQSSRIIEVSFETRVDAGEIRKVDGVSSVARAGDKHRVGVDDVPTAVHGLVLLAREHGTGISSIRTLDPSLEDAFMQLTGHDIETVEPPGDDS